MRHITYFHVEENRKYIPIMSPDLHGSIINPQWLEPPLSPTNFHSPKGVRAIEFRLYYVQIFRLSGYAFTLRAPKKQTTKLRLQNFKTCFAQENSKTGG